MVIKIILGISLIVLVFLVRLYKSKSKQLEKDLKELASKLKSSEVKFGKSFEHFVPFINNFPGNKQNTIFLGMPIDYLVFDEDSIKFVEIKTGVSKLSPKQKRIRQQIEEKKVEFHELRY